VNKTHFSSSKSKSLREKYVSETKRKNVGFVGLGHLCLICRICHKFRQVEASQNVDFNFFDDSQCQCGHTKKSFKFVLGLHHFELLMYPKRYSYPRLIIDGLILAMQSFANLSQ
jgi:hypothetical protein